MSTVFTQIIQRNIPGHILFEDQHAFCILPNGHFINPGHLLVIPKQEVDHLFDLDDEVYHHLWSLAKRFSQPLKEMTAAKRIGVAVEGFTVPHVHIHLCPLYAASELDPHRSEAWSEHDRMIFAEEFRVRLSAD